MSQMGTFNFSAIESLTGNDGVKVFAVASNVNVIGAGGITTSGDPVTGTITINGAGLASAFNADIGLPAHPVAGTIILAGGNNITTTSNGVNQITFAVTGTTEHAVQIGNATGSLTSLAVGATGETLMGSTGADPLWTNSPSFGGSVTAATGLTVSSLGLGAVLSDATGVFSSSGGGTLGQVLTSNGAAVLPTFQDNVAEITTGFTQWDAVGPYFDDTTLGDFTVLVAGYGYIHGIKTTWAAPQTVSGMVAGNTYFIYVDNTGTLQKTDTWSADLYRDNIVLFECMRDSSAPANFQVTVKENHPYNFPVRVSNYEHQVINQVIANYNNGANIVLNGTNKIQINGTDSVVDHGLTTTVPDSGGAAVTWYQYYTDAVGKWVRYTVSDTFTDVYNAAGTVSPVPAGRYGVYRLFVSKDNLNATTPTYFAILDTTTYANLGAVNTAISNGTIANITGELDRLEVCQLGYIAVGQTSGQIDAVLVSKKTYTSGTSSGGTNIASLVITNTASFDGILSGADTNVQSALDTIDEWGKTTTDHALLVGNGTGSPIGSLAVGANLEILTGVTGADPAWSATPTVTTMTATTLRTGDPATAAAVMTLSTDEITANGTDANVDVNLTTKGTGQFYIYTPSGGGQKFRGIADTGWASTEWVTQQYFLQTADATPTAIVSIPVANSEMVSVKALVNGFQDDYTDCVGGEIMVTAYRTAASDILLVGAPIINVNYTDTVDTSDIDAVVDVGTQSLLINCIGVDGQNWNWVTTISYMYTISNA